jgi:transcriptional regulator with XRE-family HTH domain
MSSDQSFGPRLRRERERRKIALESIAENSKISVSLFEEMERDDVSRWPAGIFRRSFIRAYAQAVGLDPDETARQFIERFPDPNDPDHHQQFTLTPAAGPTTAGPTSAAPTSTASPSTANSSTASPPPDPGPIPRVAPSDRLMAIAWDAGFVITLGLLLDAAFGSLWGPLCLAMAVYYGAGVLIFGATPGACLSSPAWRKSISVIRLRRYARSSSDESSRSTDSGPLHQNDASTAHPYQAPGT